MAALTSAVAPNYGAIAPSPTSTDASADTDARRRCGVKVYITVASAVLTLVGVIFATEVFSGHQDDSSICMPGTNFTNVDKCGETEILTALGLTFGAVAIPVCVGLTVEGIDRAWQWLKSKSIRPLKPTRTDFHDL